MFFPLTQNITRCIITYMEGTSFQKAQTEFTSTYPKSASPLTSVKQPFNSSTICNPSSSLKMIGKSEKHKIDGRTVLFQNKTTAYSKNLHEIVQIDVCHEGKLTMQYKKLFGDLKRIFQPAWKIQCDYQT